jgi:PAS domain-containing protein
VLKRIEELIGNDCPDLPALLDGLPVGVVLLDDEGRVLMLNKALEALTGYSRDEVRGLPCRHVLRSRACVQDCPHGRENCREQGSKPIASTVTGARFPCASPRCAWPTATTARSASSTWSRT